MKISVFCKTFYLLITFFFLTLNPTRAIAVTKYHKGNMKNLLSILQKQGYISPYSISASYGHSLAVAFSYTACGDSTHEPIIYQYICQNYYSRPLDELSTERNELKINLDSEGKRNPVYEMQLMIAWLKSIGDKRPIILYSTDKNKIITSEAFLNEQDSAQTPATEQITFAMNNQPIILIFDYAMQSYLPAFNLNSILPVDFRYLQSSQSMSLLNTGISSAMTILFILLVYYVISSQHS